ncbi:DUF6157 family protein [Paractinoplanes rishiriensis]|uniref:Uncharacterized protein n=1 Tax=Paractinoplanes rishiriensis TaxID=1050105 RepID=A0A919MWI2_9ACTN|nr:DUF6157 family protein [Actinoplanes rishiriensis]GIE97494.1 hypothetical protein Ari01nite_49590 [Actinoplanes rishiriensis]
MHSTNYQDTFIQVAEDCPAASATAPPARATPSVAERTFRMIADAPYQHTSDDVIFTVWADRNALPQTDRPTARATFFAKGQPCLRSSDLGKRYGWGIHADAEGRVALVAVGSAAYTDLAAGKAPDGTPVTVTRAMRSRRR